MTITPVRRRNERGDSSPARSMHPAALTATLPARLAGPLTPAQGGLCGLQHELRRPCQRKRHGRAHNPAVRIMAEIVGHWAPAVRWPGEPGLVPDPGEHRSGRARADLA